jgi:hypothetical protein
MPTTLGECERGPLWVGRGLDQLSLPRISDSLNELCVQNQGTVSAMSRAHIEAFSIIP